MADLDSATAAGGAIEVVFLVQVGPDPLTPSPQRSAQITAVATKIAEFMAQARSTLDIAIYDFRLRDEAASIVANALRDCARRGVIVRIAYDAATFGGEVHAPAAPAESDAKPPGTETFVTTFADVAQIRAIRGFRVLMHNKYIIRDGLTSEAAVFVGTANFTNDSWGLQENNLLFLKSQALSTYYATDFAELWSRQKITDSTGFNDTGTVQIGDVAVTVAFTPGESVATVKEIVGAICAAKRQLHVASVVISSGPILAALSEAVDRGVPLAGIYDGPQMDTVIRQWREANVGADRISAWQKVAAHLVRKNSLPWDSSKPGQPHNFMHNKLVVADDRVITGSFNLSHHAMGNAENTLLLRDPGLADKYRDYLRRVIGIYAPS